MTAETRDFRDTVARFVFEAGPVRGALVSLDEVNAQILACHEYPPAVARVLSELLAASALLASALKFEGSLTVQLQGDGPVRLLVVECDAALNLRATAQWSDAVDALPEDASLAALAGGSGRSRLAIILDPRNGDDIYQGIVALESADVATLIEHYLETSEQIPSRLLLARSGTAGAHARSAGRVRGLLLQRMPGPAADPDDADALWTRAADRIPHIAPDTLAEASTLSGFLSSQFPEDDLRLFRGHPARFRCSCSAARVDNALRMIGRDEVEDILAEQGEVGVTCEFCNRRYAYGREAALALFARPGDGRQPEGPRDGIPDVRH